VESQSVKSQGDNSTSPADEVSCSIEMDEPIANYDDNFLPSKVDASVQTDIYPVWLLLFQNNSCYHQLL